MSGSGETMRESPGGFVAFDTTAISALPRYGAGAVLEASVRDQRAIGIPLEALAEALKGRDAEDRRGLIRRLVYLHRRVTFLTDAICGARFEVGLTDEATAAEQLSVIVRLLHDDLQPLGLLAALDRFLAKDQTAEWDAAERARHSAYDKVTAADGERFIDGLPEKLLSDAAWAVRTFVADSERGPSLMARVGEATVGRALLAALEIHALGNAGCTGGRYSRLWKSKRNNVNGWVDARIIAASIQADVFVSDDSQQREVFATIATRLFARQPLVVDLETWLQGPTVA